MIKFFCTSCGQKLAVQEMQVGGKVLCPSCGKQQMIPEQETGSPLETPAAQQKAGLRPIPEAPGASPLDYSLGFQAKERIIAGDAARAKNEEAARSARSDVSAGVAPPPEPGLRAITTPEESRKGELRQTLQSGIDRASRTISEFMAEKNLKGAVDLNATDDPSSAQNILTADQGRKYVLGDVVAKGGMGAIIEAKDANIIRNVAMKVILNPQDASKETILRFIQEAQVTSQLEHPSIVPVHELGVDGSGNVFYTMKFVRGVTLKDLLAKIRHNDPATVENYPLAHLLNIFQKVCDAIAFAHSKRVIHRDLKPENVMIGNYGEVLVMDWGLAKVLPKKEQKLKRHVFIKARDQAKSPDTHPKTPTINSVRGDTDHGDMLKTMDGAIMGTPGFMAPEQAIGKLDQMDQCTDIYALGAILYNILTLRPPIEGRDLSDVLRRVTMGDFPPPTSFNPKSGKAGRGIHACPEQGRSAAPALMIDGAPGTARPTEEKMVHPLPHLPGNLVPDSLSAVTMKALEVDPANRYPTVQALQKEIEAYQGGFATSAEEASPWRHTQLFFKRHKAVAVLGSLTIIGVIGGTVLSTALWASAARERNTTREALASLKGSAPALIAQARNCVEQGDISNAVRQATYAVALIPGSPEYHVFMGDMLECSLKITAASKSYEKALELLQQQAVAADSPAVTNTALHRHARDNLDLCRKILAETKDGRLSEASVANLHTAMRDQDRIPESLLLLRFLSKDVKKEELMFRSILDKRAVKYTGLTVATDGLCNLDLTGTLIADLRLLQGLPLASLNLAKCDKLSDISPLRGMSLTSLNLGNCVQVSDLAPLKGMPLTALDIQGCIRISDLSPLTGMPLKTLDLSGCGRITDLAPIKDLSLTALHIRRCAISDLSILKGMPLRTLSLSDCVQVTDLSPLKDLRLTSLSLNGCAGIADFSLLKDMKTLIQLPDTDLWPLVSKPLMQSIAAKNADQAEIDARKLVADFSGLPALAGVVQKTRPYSDVIIPQMKNPDAAPAGTKTFNGHHYYLWPFQMKWTDAKQFCESLGGHLATITSKEEYVFVMQLTDNKSQWNVGLTKEGTNIKWISGESWDATVPSKIAATNGPCGCLLASGFDKGKPGDFWLDGDIDRSFIIEWDR